MNKILALCIGLLVITLPLSSQEGDSSVKPAPQAVNGSMPNANAAGLGPLPTVLCLLIPAATLGFIHSRS